jgi:Arc/MetJ-type ribon-helix-helix transcriptional regulator
MPAQLVEEALSLVNGGWYRDLDEVLSDALRRFLDSHRMELTEQFIREDVNWGLYGKE